MFLLRWWTQKTVIYSDFQRAKVQHNDSTKPRHELTELKSVYDKKGVTVTMLNYLKEERKKRSDSFLFCSIAILRSDLILVQSQQ